MRALSPERRSHQMRAVTLMLQFAVRAELRRGAAPAERPKNHKSKPSLP